jgi:hypothetical protein
MTSETGRYRISLETVWDASHFLRKFGQNVALDGFYKYPDGTVAPMPNEEFYEFD